MTVSQTVTGPARQGASAQQSATPLGFDEFERRGLQGAFQTALRGRLVILAVVSAVTMWLAFVDPAVWRRSAMACLVVGLAIIDVYTRRRFRRHGVEPSSVHRNLAGMIFFQAALIVTTGGLSSPLLPIMLPGALLAGLLGDRAGVRRLVLGLQVPVLAALAIVHTTNVWPSLVPLPFRGHDGASLTRLWFAGAAATALVVGIGLFGSRLRQEARANLERLQAAQSAALTEHQQRADDLTTLSGEIAHELKNPLASIKGLVQLLARSHRRDDAKTAERIAVLEREVVRMQATLEEFLNFSRPLTPLTREAVDVHGLCTRLGTLHEGMVAARGVSVRVEVPQGLVVDADARKLGQVLMNLLQNAIEAAPVGSFVAIRGRQQASETRIEVHDRGTGLEASVAQSVFDPGVTTKAHGNGLGLTVARAIVQQHQGSLTLGDSPHGGCVATVVLPGHERGIER